MDAELLISLVEQYKKLYDIQHPNYNVQSRNNIWEEIGGVIKESGGKNHLLILFIININYCHGE